MQELRELKMPKTLPGSSCGTLTRRTKTEGGKEEKDTLTEGRRVEEEVTSVTEGKRIEAQETDAAGVGVNWKAASGAQSPKAEIGWPRVGVTRKGSLEMRKSRGRCQRRCHAGDSSAHGSKLGMFADGR